MARSVIYAPGVTTDTSPSKDARPYHHGDLPRALLDAAVHAILEVGPAAVSLRDLARRTGVSHAAPAHHFGDKAGLLTAVATDGFQLLAATLGEAYQATGSFLEVGVAYVRFAATHRAHFEVMFRPEL
jgi:AcrR family transcriptional regulator